MLSTHSKSGSSDIVDDNADSTNIQNEHSSQKQKKRVNKIIESILRDLPQLNSTEEKLHSLCQKFHDVSVEHNDSVGKSKQLENTLKIVYHERNQLQSERNRLILQKDKLETLCREVQKHSKVVQEESLARARAEDEKRRQVSDHFQSSITGIQKQLHEYQTRNSTLHKENQNLADKLKQFITQHEKREAHVDKIIETRNLEVKLAEAKLDKNQCLLEQQSIKHQQTISGMQHEATAMEERMQAHLDVEKKLREQIDFYKTKYQTFNKTMANNNRLFENAKTEMEKLVKRVRLSEHDIIEWRGKWELSQRSMLEVVTELNNKDNEATSAKKQVDRLSGLCRALQTQLAEIRKNASVDSRGDEGNVDHREEAGQGQQENLSEVKAAATPHEVKPVVGESCQPTHDSTDPAPDERILDSPILVEEIHLDSDKTAEKDGDHTWVSISSALDDSNDGAPPIG